MFSEQKRVFARWVYDLIGEKHAGLSKVSLQYWETGEEEPPLTGQHCVIESGHGALAEKLQRDLEICGGKVVLNSPVSAITFNGDAELNKNQRVTVETSSGGEVSTLEAEFCLVTVPLGVLKGKEGKGIKFSPELDDAKKAVIERLGFDCINHVVLFFKKCHWDEQAADVAYVKDTTSCLTVANLFPSTETPALVVTIHGPLALEIEGKTDEEATDFCLEIAQKVHPEIKKNKPIQSKVTRWAKDEFAKGASTHLAPGGSPNDMDTLAQSVGDYLFFAGEATHSVHFATTQGALLSGKREAKKIAHVVAKRNGLL